MRFEHTNSYPASPDAVRSMLLSEDFRNEVSRAQQAVEHQVRISGNTVRIQQRQSMAAAPSIARRITGDSIEIVHTEDWTSATGADFAMEIPGKPGHLRGTIELRETNEGTDEVFTGEVKVSVPLVGGKLEKLIGDTLRRALRREGKSGVTWLTGD